MFLSQNESLIISLNLNNRCFSFIYKHYLLKVYNGVFEWYPLEKRSVNYWNRKIFNCVLLGADYESRDIEYALNRNKRCIDKWIIRYQERGLMQNRVKADRPRAILIIIILAISTNTNTINTNNNNWRSGLWYYNFSDKKSF